MRVAIIIIREKERVSFKRDSPPSHSEDERKEKESELRCTQLINQLNS